MRALLVACLLLPAAAPPAAVRSVDSREALVAAVRAARPGDRIEIAAGTYAGGLQLVGAAGDEKRPIVIAAADRASPPVFEGGTSGMQISGARWIVLEDLVFRGATGNGLNVDDGGVIEAPAEGITLRRLRVEDVGPSGNRDGIKLSGVRRFRVEDCVVERWGDRGSGIDMVGCHDGVISGCTFRHGRGKGSNGVQAKGGTSRISVERCRFEEAGLRAVQLGGSTGREFFRPAPAAADNAEGRELTVTGCTIVGSDAAVAFVGAVDCVVRRNTIYRPRAWVLRVLQETQGDDFVPCARGRFERNLVVWHDGDLRATVNVGPGTDAGSFAFAGNWWWCPDAADRVRLGLPAEEEGGVTGRDPRLVDPENGDLRLRSGSPARDVGAP